MADPTADTADADWLADPSCPRPSDVPLIEEPVAEDAEESAEEPAELPEEPVEEPAAEESEDSEDTVEVKQASSRRKGRSSVPSWDEIMFGGSAKED